MSIKNITVTLSKVEVTEIVKAYLRREMPGYEPKGFDFKMTRVYSGYGMNESSSDVFSVIEIEMDKAVDRKPISDQRDSSHFLDR